MNTTELPRTIDELMELYSDYEKENRKRKKKKNRTEDYKVTLLQYKTFKSNPITTAHEDYYETKYKTKLYRISNLFLILSILFYLLYFGGFIIEAYIFKSGIEDELIPRLILFAFSTGYVILFVAIFRKKFNKWNWVWYATISTVLITIIFPALASILTGVEATLINILYTISGLSLAPACLIFYLTYISYSYITDYGGIHLFFGWIYRISKTHGNLKSIHLSFEKLILDLDSWLINTLKLTIKNKTEIIESFSLNIITDEEFIDNISNDKDEFEKVLNGLLVEEILSSDTFSKVKKEHKKINCLNKFYLKNLSYIVAKNQLPKIIKLIEKLSSKKVEVLFYTFSKRLSKFILKVMPPAIPAVVGALIPLTFQFFL